MSKNMSESLKYRGNWVTISRDKGSTVNGWFIGEIPQGLLIALDEDLTDIRLIQKDCSIGYNHEKRLSKLSFENARQLSEELQTTNDAISDYMRNAISKIKFDRLHQFGFRSTQLLRQIHIAKREKEMRWSIDPTPRDELMGFMIAQADRSTALHRDVYETFEDAGLTTILDEFGQKLIHLPAELTLPAYDLEFSSREDLTSAIESAREQQ